MLPPDSKNWRPIYPNFHRKPTLALQVFDWHEKLDVTSAFSQNAGDEEKTVLWHRHLEAAVFIPSLPFKLGVGATELGAVAGTTADAFDADGCGWPGLEGPGASVE
jgi:hypothetical protein